MVCRQTTLKDQTEQVELRQQMVRKPFSFQIVTCLSIVAIWFAGCATVQRLDPGTASRYEGFVRDGSTAKQEVLGRLGPAQSSYENERILIYHVFLDKDDRMNLYDGGGTCTACVLVFDNDDVLEKHSLVKHGCRKKAEP